MNIMDFMNITDEGYIIIDEKRNINIYNDKAKEIFGLKKIYKKYHDKGKLEEGDILIIANNGYQIDDGGLLDLDLKKLNIDKKLDYGDSFIYIGAYKSNKSPKFIYGKEHNNLILKELYEDLVIEVIINEDDKYIDIKVDNETYKMNFFSNIGHMVILNKDKKLKFYQSEGYTARRESIKDILDLKEFSDKKQLLDEKNIIGKDILLFHDKEDAIRDLIRVGKGENISYEDKILQINKKPVMCSLYKLKDNQAILKIKDIRFLQDLIEEREILINKIKSLKIEAQKISFIDEFIGDSEEIKKIKMMALKASKSNSTIILTGESGVGKTSLAKLIHKQWQKKDSPFIHVNCPSIPENLMESEFFGYEKGAFTGALNTGKIGFFELANGGTIFLDEIGELSLNMQSKLLEVLQSKSFYKIGGNKKMKLNVRIICATNKDLEIEIKNKNFRSDLYYRINIINIEIPPLRKRKGDIAIIANELFPKLCKNLDIKEKIISKEGLRYLSSLKLYGNVRELENILERAINYTENNILFKKDFILDTQEDVKEDFFGFDLKENTKRLEKRLMKKVLKECNYDSKKAMELLNIKKTSFYEKLKKYEIKIKSEKKEL